jgi:hypothetical protein
VLTACALASPANINMHNPSPSQSPIHLPAPRNRSFVVSFIRISSFFVESPQGVHPSLAVIPAK